MLTQNEQSFITHWAVQRTKKRSSGFNIGFPAGVLLVVAIFISIITGWHKQATIALRSDTSTILVILVAGVAIVVFMWVFAARYQWEQKEQRYQELLGRETKPTATPDEPMIKNEPA